MTTQAGPAPDGELHVVGQSVARSVPPPASTATRPDTAQKTMDFNTFIPHLLFQRPEI